MTLKIACQMDPIERIDIRGDSTFAILLEAQNARARHLLLHAAEPRAARRPAVGARAFAERARQGRRPLQAGRRRASRISPTCDVVLLRQDPPFDMAYITTTHLLERIHPKTLVVNDPAHVRNAPEKMFVLDFLDLMPPTLVTRSLDDVHAFRAEHKDIIIKPLYGNGGASVFRIQPGDTNLGSLVELFQTVFREPFMVQQYRPEVRDGDKRIILVDGEVAGAINRVPAAGETRSNLHVGGTRRRDRADPARSRDLRAAWGPS